MKSVLIYVYRGRAYIPMQVEAEGGILLDTDPVLVVHLELNELVQAAEQLLESGHPRIITPSRQEMKAHARVALRATKTHSWAELGRDGTAYNLVWEEDKTLVIMHRPDKKGRWEPDPLRSRQLPPDTSIQDIVQVILDDVRLRPDLLAAR